MALSVFVLVLILPQTAATRNIVDNNPPYDQRYLNIARNITTVDAINHPFTMYDEEVRIQCSKDFHPYSYQVDCRNESISDMLQEHRISNAFLNNRPQNSYAHEEVCQVLLICSCDKLREKHTLYIPYPAKYRPYNRDFKYTYNYSQQADVGRFVRVSAYWYHTNRCLNSALTLDHLLVNVEAMPCVDQPQGFFRFTVKRYKSLEDYSAWHMPVFTILLYVGTLLATVTYHVGKKVQSSWGKGDFWPVPSTANEQKLCPNCEHNVIV